MFDLQKHLQKFQQICFQKRWEILPNTMFQLGQCAAIVESLRFLPLSPQVRGEMLQVSLVKGAMATTAIEGDTLSEEEVRLIQEGKSTIPPSRKYLEQEVKNVLDALNTILADVVERNAIASVTPEMIKAFNKQVGHDLGDAFESVPGQFREHEVVVGAYRPPDHRDVTPLVEKMCEWLRREFGFSEDAEPDFYTGVIEAIVAHVYLVWIHPFGDGNGRSARLLEFYLLLRGGLPDICSHILSNHYNDTRSEYYRQLGNAGKKNDLTDFIAYAVRGLLDGLRGILFKSQNHQLKAYWKNYIHAELDAMRILKPVRKRCAVLLSELELFKDYQFAELAIATPAVATAYPVSMQRALSRDVKMLVQKNLLLVNEDGRYRINTDILLARLPRCRRYHMPEAQS